MPEAWHDFYTVDEIKKIQAIELRSLDVLMEVCDKLGIRFFMYGGSLLGVVKYKGFIPWDDDLDIAMLRVDYEKFIKEAPRLLPKEYEVQHPKTNERTPYPYIKFRRTDTALVEYRSHKIKMNHGVYFDIYPIDNMPDAYEAYLKQKIIYDKWVSIFLVRQNYHLDKDISAKKKLILLPVRLFQSVIAHLLPLKYIMHKIDEISTKFNSQRTINQGNLTFPKPVNYFKGVDFVEAEFEGRRVYIPSGYEINLRNRYGDIERLPPVDKRVGHKPYILNLGEVDNNVC